MARKDIFLTILLVLLALSSCSKESSRRQGEMDITNGSLMGFSAVPDEEFTKAYANASTGVVSWEDGDRIMVSNGGSESQEFVYNSSTQLFENTSGVGVRDDGKGFVMIYPASIYTGSSLAGNTFTVNVNLPATQTLRDRSTCNKPL